MKVITRIKYTKFKNALISSILTNRFGEKFSVEIYPEFIIFAKEKNKKFIIILKIECYDIQKAKKIARNLLISQFSVNLIQEIRPRK